MTLIIQIALGILLGYLLIEHRHRLAGWAVVALQVALCLLAVAAVITAVWYVVSSAPGWIEREAPVLIRFASIAAGLLVMSFAAYGVLVLARKGLGRWLRLEFNILLFIFLLAANILAVTPLEALLRGRTLYGDWYNSLFLWLQRNGHDVDLVHLIGWPLLLWPWAIILVAQRLGVSFDYRLSTLEAAEGEIDQQGS